MRIGIDVDDVVADLLTPWLRRFYAQYPDKVPMGPGDLTKWELWEELGCTKKEIFALLTPNIYTREVKPIPGALEAVRAIRDLGHEVVFVTACKGHHNGKEMFKAKCDWLDENGFTGIVTQIYAVGPAFHWQSKAEVPVDWLIDDYPGNLEDFPGVRILVTKPHNRNSYRGPIQRIKQLGDVVPMLKYNSIHAPFGIHDPLFPIVSGTQKDEPIDGLEMPAWDNWGPVVIPNVTPMVAKAMNEMKVLPTEKQARKETPITTGVLDYFPLAIAEVARVSKAGNDQHNPGEPLHWARHKSTDQADCIARHLVERGTIDEDGQRHSAKMAWRALALLQLELESVTAGV